MNQRIGTAKSLVHWMIVPLIATSMVLWPTYSSGLETLQNDAGDTLLNAYLLEHAYQHLTSINIFNSDQFWSPTFFWPVQGTLTWSDHLLGQSVIYGIFRPIFNPINAYVCWISATLILNYVSIRKALKKISPNTKDIWISISTLVTTFSPAITVQLGHPQLLSLFIIGPILYECHRLITEKAESFTLSNWIYLSFLLLINGFFNIYTFVYACYGVLICLAIHIFKRIVNRTTQFRLGKNLTFNTGLLVITGFINMYIYLPYLQTLKIFGSRPIELIINNLPKPASWLLGNNWLLIPPAWNYETINPDWISGQEQAIFPGWGLLALLSAAVLTLFRKDKNAGIQNWLVAIALMILLTLSFNGETGWLVIMKILPGSGSLRASSRVAMMIILFSAPCIALAAENWRWRLKDFWSTTCEFCALSAGFASIWAISGGQHQFPYKKWENELIAVNNVLKKTDCDVFWYEWEKSQQPFRAHVLAMHAQLRTNMPTANGYSGQFPSNDWPFTNPSGQNGFKWLEKELPYTNHASRETQLYPKKCIVTVNKNNVASIKYYVEKAAQSPKIILNQKGIKIGDDGQRLYFSLKENKLTSSPIWARLIRDGKSIPAYRGDYQITNARIENGTLFITDTSQAANNKYIWKVNPKTGIFLSQVYRDLNQENR